MSYLVPLIKDPRNFAVNAALNAVGLAALSNIRMSPQMMIKARREYTTALSHTNHALRDPIKSKQDDILAAVVLLGMFEVSYTREDILSITERAYPD
jgi:tRNA U34 5-carboxymethylaminomethyl modifying GTPase MnmE/TrmE